MRQCERCSCTSQLSDALTREQDPLTKTRPLFPYPALANAATTVNIDITAGPNKTGHFLWYMNAQSFRANYDYPVYLLAAAGNTSYPYDPVRWPSPICNRTTSANIYL